ncbi:MAG: glycoside hydrolase domain-containing protein [Planctomycetota bacterium]
MRNVWAVVARVLAAALVLGVPQAFSGEPAAAEVGQSILTEQSYWRAYAVIREAEVPLGLLKEKKPEATAPASLGFAGFQMAPPPAGWAKPEFDDLNWPRASAPFIGWRGHARWYSYHGEGLLCLRGRFEVKDPAAVRKLTLSARYHGGMVFYLNGKEVLRGHMPAGEITPETPAEPYPAEAYVDAAGKLLTHDLGHFDGWEAKQPGAPDRADVVARLARRDSRELTAAELPVKDLRKGVNVLAVELHRSAYRPEALKWQERKQFTMDWEHIGLENLRLTAEAAEGAVAPNVSRPKGLQVWNQDMHLLFGAEAYGDPNEALRPVRLVGARNGYYSGTVVASSDRPIEGLKAQATDLEQAGKAGKISVSNVRLRYALPTELGFQGTVLAALADEPPGNVEPAGDKGKGAVQPVWVTVHVPKDAPAGSYKGSLSLSATGLSEVNVPVELEVIDWTLPEPGDYRSFVGFYQSPESVALQYDVPMWSEEHWKRLEKSFHLLGCLGNNLLVVPLVTQSQFGNDESMAPWIKQPDGSFTYDFSAFDRYLALARKHCTIEVISLVVWHGIPGGVGFSNDWGTATPDKPTFMTVVDPATKKTEPMQLPVVGTEESKKMWRPFLEQVREHLKAGGFDKVTPILGITAEGGIHNDVLNAFKEIWPEARWHYGGHGRGGGIGGKGPHLGYFEYMYVPGSLDPPDPPDKKRPYYWWTPHPEGVIITGAQRIDDPHQPPMSMRTMAERYMILGDKGPGRMGLDYWPVKGAVKGWGTPSLLGRWPMSTSGQRVPQLRCLALPGKDGALATVRLEALREGFQEAEARAFVELLLAENKLSGDLAEKTRRLLGKRYDLCRVTMGHFEQAPFLYIGARFCLDEGWQKRSEELYRLAAEVAAKPGGK